MMLLQLYPRRLFADMCSKKNASPNEKAKTFLPTFWCPPGTRYVLAGNVKFKIFNVFLTAIAHRIKPCVPRQTTGEWETRGQLNKINRHQHELPHYLRTGTKAATFQAVYKQGASSSGVVCSTAASSDNISNPVEIVASAVWIWHGLRARTT